MPRTSIASGCVRAAAGAEGGAAGWAGVGAADTGLPGGRLEGRGVYVRGGRLGSAASSRCETSIEHDGRSPRPTAPHQTTVTPTLCAAQGLHAATPDQLPSWSVE